MADKKISALTSATTPLAGTEVLPIVQSSTTVKVAVSDLTAGRAFDALSMTLTSTDAGATAAPLIDLYRNSASPAASDTIGEIEFNGKDSAGNKQQYALIHGSILSPTSTTEQGQIHFETATAGASTEKMIIGTTNLVINEIGAVFNVRIEGDTDANLFYTDATNDRIGVGIITPDAKLTVRASGTENVGNQIANFTSATSGDGVFFFLSNGTAHGNASLPTIAVNKNVATGRSINAEGTINASGADYAEYMTKASNFIVAKGDVVGIDAQGKLTNVFVDAVSFVVKSTDPSYVGGDSWGSVDVIGKRPDVDATQAEKDAFETVLEVARQRVDRISFAGQVPVNVLGATAGQYIIPVNDNGAIKGEAVSSPTFEQYQISVGKVIAIEADGRARIIVKVA